MIEAATVAALCGFINVVCIHRHLKPHNPSQNAHLCEFVENRAELCKSKAPPIYPILKKDRT
jgi:hypothetical protein